jgi:hypothetical protein
MQTPDIEERVLGQVEENLGVSMRQVAAELNAMQMNVWRALHKLLLYPLHLQWVQGLKPADCSAQETLCQWFGQQCSVPLFLLLVLFSGDTCLGWDGILDFHSHHHWAEDNPHGVLQSRHQQQFNVNIWAGIVGDCLVGPHISLQTTTTEISC